MRKITKTVRGYTFDWYSEEELLEIFPHIKETLHLTLAERQEEYNQQTEIVRKLLTSIEGKPPGDIPAYEALIERFHVSKLLETENHIFRLKRLLTLAKGKPQYTRKYKNFEERKNVAKNFPIYELARSQIPLKPSGRNFVGLCPLHTEKTPSFYLYTETNSFYCFGCQAGGDVITLTMHLYGIGFADAVRMLN